MTIIRSLIFSQFTDLDFGLSTKYGLNRINPHYFNTSLSVGDIPEVVEENRNNFYGYFKLNKTDVAIQKQEHTDIVTKVEKAGFIGESDAMITDRINIGLIVSTADCGNIYVYDNENRVIAGIHSGWKGTAKRIVYKTIEIMKNDYNCKPKNLFVYMGPSISKDSFEVKEDVKSLFENKYIHFTNSKIFVNLPQYNFDMLKEQNIPSKNIQISNLCSFREKNLLQSYRREGKFSGRAFGLIVLKEKR
ncbi:MAG TPA: peptidoglycan editing factor PgeF [Melioribacteraceae bacterium]|nr:peptidoglycan editing factor PgeF [Melioribacteraceae bacterium]